MLLPTRHQGRLGYHTKDRPQHELQYDDDHRDQYHEEPYNPKGTRFTKSSSFNPYKNGQRYENSNHFIQRKPQEEHLYNNENKDNYYGSHYDRFRSYGARVPKKDYYDEADYYETLPYQRINYREPNHYREERQTSVLDNIRNNLPWPLSIVGRIGENDKTSRSDENIFPDSIQSILKVIDSKNDVGKEYDAHQVLPFLDVDEV